MSASLFQGATSKAGESSRAQIDSEVDSDEDRPSQPSGARAGATPAQGGQGIYRVEAKGANLKGRVPVGHDSRKFKYDVTRGMGAKLGFEASKDDRMSAVEAGATLHRIHQLQGVDTLTEGVLRAFDKALFFCHTVNGGSVLAPGRATFVVPGVTQTFSYAVIRDLLGADQRRFFRAFADEIADVNREVLRDYDPFDPVNAEHWGWLQQVAYERGLHRFPYLCHDSADACVRLSPVERAALASSKAMVISTTNNSADRLRANNRVSSADGYDSTVGERS